MRIFTFNLCIQIEKRLSGKYIGMSNKITLRPFEESDIETYRHWINDPETGSLLDRVLPVTIAEHKVWYQNLVTNRNAVVFSVIHNEIYIGNVWLWDINWRHRKSEVRVLIGDKDNRSRGLGVQMIGAISDYAFRKLNLNKVYAYVLKDNEAAVKAFGRAGFLVEGILKNDRFVNGKYQDVLLMARL